MPTYISLVNWTEQGVRNVKDTVERQNRADEVAEKHGVRVVHFYWTVGPYDAVAIGEAPDDESMTAFILAVGSAGNVRTTTLRAYNQEEMSGILGRLG